MKAVVIDILEWFGTGADFDQGIALLRQVSNNHYYINNIARARRDSTLRYELGKYLKKAGIVKKQPEVGGRKPEAASPKPEASSARPEVASARPEVASAKLQPVTEKFRIRNEFPFLADKDCPDEFKILVADMITAHDNYVQGHPALYGVANKGNAACFEAARNVVKNFKENRLIWSELEYYKKHGKIEGKHPIFKRRREESQMKAMNLPELVNLRKNLNRQLIYREKLLKQKKGTADIGQRRIEIQEIKRKIKLVDKLINNHVGQ